MRDIHWENHFVQILDMREDNPIGWFMGKLLENLREIHWESYMVKMMEMRYEPPMEWQLRRFMGK